MYCLEVIISLNAREVTKSSFEVSRKGIRVHSAKNKDNVFIENNQVRDCASSGYVDLERNIEFVRGLGPEALKNYAEDTYKQFKN